MRLTCATSDNGQTPVRRVTQTGTLSSGSPVVTGLSSTAAIAGALQVSGAGLPAGTLVQSVDSTTQVTLTQNATASGSASLAFTLEPITLAEAKLHLRVDFTDDDLLIASLVAAARRVCETHLKQSLLTQQWTLYLDSFPSAGGYYNRAIREVWPSMGGMPSGLGFYPGMVPNSTGVINLAVPPVQSVDSVKYYDFQGVLQTVDPSLYNASLGTPPRIQPAYSKVWPISRPTIDSVQVNFTAGYGDTADKLPDAVKSAVKLLVGNWYRNRESVVTGTIVAVLPQAVDSLLASLDHGCYA